MSFQNDVPIIQKTYDLYRELNQIIERMPKKDKYNLGERIEKGVLDLLEYLLTASYCKRENKLVYLKKASIRLELIKILIRLAEELNVIPTKKYLQVEAKLVEIGKMLGGWMRSTKAL